MDKKINRKNSFKFIFEHIIFSDTYKPSLNITGNFLLLIFFVFHEVMVMFLKNPRKVFFGLVVVRGVLPSPPPS